MVRTTPNVVDAVTPWMTVADANADIQQMFGREAAQTDFFSEESYGAAMYAAVLLSSGWRDR